MKLLIDEGLSTLQQLGGIGYHSVYLWRHLKKYVECNMTNYHYLETFPRVLKRAIYLSLANIEPLRHKYDIIHYQNYYMPRFLGNIKGVATIHDLGGLKYPEVYPGWYNAYLRKVLRDTIKRSDIIILSTQAVAGDFFEMFPGVDRSRVKICHYGIRPIFFESQSKEEDIAPMNLKPYSYFLFVGNLEKRKNLRSLLSQFALARKYSQISKETKLVLVGKKVIGSEEIEHLISQENNIVYLGRLSDQQLIPLYKFCKAFMFPSLYEGFGIPIIEAMSQKVPILISNIAPSLELNNRHNNQCFVLNLDRSGTLIEILSHLDKNYFNIASNLNYGDLSMYSYDNVAQEHMKVYSNIL